MRRQTVGRTLRHASGHLAAGLALIGFLVLAASSSATRAESAGRIYLAQSTELVLPNGRFASSADYLAGTWLSHHDGERRQLRFSRNGEFTFHSRTNSVYGRFEASPHEFRLWLHRVCDNKGQNCDDRRPPKLQTNPLQPIDAGEFRSADETWRRISRE